MIHPYFTDDQVAFVLAFMEAVIADLEEADGGGRG